MQGPPAWQLFARIKVGVYRLPQAWVLKDNQFGRWEHSLLHHNPAVPATTSGGGLGCVLGGLPGLLVGEPTVSGVRQCLHAGSGWRWFSG